MLYQTGDCCTVLYARYLTELGKISKNCSLNLVLFLNEEFEYVWIFVIFQILGRIPVLPLNRISSGVNSCTFWYFINRESSYQVTYPVNIKRYKSSHQKLQEWKIMKMPNFAKRSTLVYITNLTRAWFPRSKNSKIATTPEVTAGPRIQVFSLQRNKNNKFYEFHLDLKYQNKRIEKQIEMCRKRHWGSLTNSTFETVFVLQ